ncbi:hypothetical protein JB92DRAFT_3147787 [Gautieria morchelliformis]|nr:hypothetical protein JB92DRAFT_3147787 [Gautieria morchelliformis]
MDDSLEEVCPHGQLSSDRVEQFLPRNDDLRLSSDTGFRPRISAHTLTPTPTWTASSRSSSSTRTIAVQHGMAWAHFEQAAAPFWAMDSAFADSSLSHLLKRSSAALGVQKVQRSCEQIQNLGERRDIDADVQPGAEEGHDAAKGGEGRLTRRRPLRARVEAGAEVRIGFGFELDLVQVRILYV